MDVMTRYTGRIWRFGGQYDVPAKVAVYIMNNLSVQCTIMIKTFRNVLQLFVASYRVSCFCLNVPSDTTIQPEARASGFASGRKAQRPSSIIHLRH